MSTPLPTGYCISSRFLDLDIIKLNYTNIIPDEYNDGNNFIHFASEKDVKPIACIFLIHGLHGSENDFDNFVKILKREYPNKNENMEKDDGKLLKAPPTIILRSTLNRGMLPTMQGVEECALRAVAEITQCLKLRPSIKYLTVVGHSFGGLIARNMLEKLFSSDPIPSNNNNNNNIKKMKHPMEDEEEEEVVVQDKMNDIMKNVTLVDLFLVASPCIGVRRPGSFFTSPFNATFKFGAPIIAGTTGTELLINDEDKIVYKMSKAKYTKVLEKFNRRVLYGNVFVSILSDFTIFVLSILFTIDTVLFTNHVLYNICIIYRMIFKYHLLLRYLINVIILSKIIM